MSRVTSEEVERAIYDASVLSIREPLEEVLKANHLLADFAALGDSGLRGLLTDLPTMCVEIQQHRQWAKNASLRPKESDLYDWGYVATTSCHCDVVVTEKQLADMLSRDGFKTYAVVVSRLEDLLPHIAPG